MVDRTKKERKKEGKVLKLWFHDVRFSRLPKDSNKSRAVVNAAMNLLVPSMADSDGQFYPQNLIKNSL